MNNPGKERPIGDRFMLGGVCYEVMEEPSYRTGRCTGCGAQLSGWATHEQQDKNCDKFIKKGGPCMDACRSDGKGVIFKEVKRYNEDE